MRITKPPLLSALALALAYWLFHQGVADRKAPIPFDVPEQLKENSGAVVAQANTTIADFNEAKRKAWAIFQGMEKTFYCNCPYQGKTVQIESCGYKPLNPADPRSQSIEWEHIVPAHAFGQSFKEWRQGHPLCVDSKGKPYKGRK